MRQIGLQHCHLSSLFIGQIHALRLGKRLNTVLSLLDQLVDDGYHGGIVEHNALVHFALLAGGQQQPNRAQALAVLGAHGGFHVFGDLVFE